MQRKLVSSGTGWKLYMPKDVLKLLGFNPNETEVLLKIDKNKLKITKADPDKNNQDLLIKKFNRCGNGYGIYISNSIIQFLEIDPELDEVKYTIENDVLNISKAVL